jgi:hypothetical protein
MIPSNNDPKITVASFGPTQGMCPRWTCDCCQRSYEQDWLKENAEPGILVPSFIEVKAVKYFACSQDCARILSNIHHQYAMREVPQEKRFVDLSTQFDRVRPNILDLDAVVQMAFEEDGYPNPPSSTPDAGMGWLYWWTSDVAEKKTAPEMPRDRAKEIIDLWKARPSFMRFVGKP